MNDLKLIVQVLGVILLFLSPAIVGATIEACTTTTQDKINFHKECIDTHLKEVKKLEIELASEKQ